MKPFKLQSKADITSACTYLINELVSVSPPYNLLNNKVYYLKLFNDKQLKSDNQNRFFHSLLEAFWSSGCSSFTSYDDARLYYKRLAGLVKLKEQRLLNREVAKPLFFILKKIPNNVIDDKGKQQIYDTLKGKIEVEQSWSYVSKEKASFAIQELVNDCINSGAYVSSNKVKEIIDGASGDMEDWINVE